MARGFAMLLFGALQLASLAAATASTSSSVKCYTSSGYSKCNGHLPTSSSTTHHTCTAEVTKTPTSTVTQTPAEKTVTVHKTITSTSTVTASQNTDTFTTTSTDTSTAVVATLTLTADATSYSTTVTTSYTTTTRSTSDGFTPIASYTYMEPTRTLDKRSGTYVTAVNVLRARGESDPEPTYAPAVKKIRGAGLEVSVNPDLKVGKLVGGKIECPKPLYPEKVVCVKSVEVIETKTATAKSAKKVTKTLPAKTTTKTVLATTTSTKTVPNADASTTVTSTTSTVVTSTATTVTTTTQTATVTSTDVEASPTIYANCQPNNIISQFNGVNINGVSFPNGILSNTFPVNDAPSCCINCVNAPNCGGFAWAEGNCILFNDGNGGTTCDPTAVAFQFSTGFLGRQQPPSNVGNANCGQGAYTGQ